MLIKELAGDHTIILSTHILPEVSQTCQRVVIINKGKVVAVDTPDNLTDRLQRLGDDVRPGGCQRRGRVRRAQPRRGRDARRRIGPARRPRRLRSGQRERARRAPRAGEHGRDAAAGAWSSCGPTRISLEEVFLVADRRRRSSRRRRPEETNAMRNILAIAHKELRSYFASPIAYIVIGCFAAAVRVLLRRDPGCFVAAEHAGGPDGRRRSR